MQISISQLQQTVPPIRAESRGELEGLQSHFTACLSSTNVGGKTTTKKKEKKKKNRGNILAESTISTGFGLF